MEEKIVYFEEPGKVNTETTLELAKDRALRRGIKKVVLATTTGFTAVKALAIFKSTDVTLTIGAWRSRIPESLVHRIGEEGHNCVFCNETVVDFPEISKGTLRRFSEGMRVCVHIVMSATEAGLIHKGEKVIAVGGTGYLRFKERGGGADTAIVMEAADSKSFFKIEPRKEERRKIREIICKPL